MAALQTGSSVLARRFVEWLSEGGCRTSLARGFGSAFSLFVAGGIVYAAPVLAVVPVVGWVVGAVLAGRKQLQREENEAAFVQLLRNLEFGHVREQCQDLGIPVRDSLKVAGAVSPGVHVGDLLGVWDVHVTTPPPVEREWHTAVTRENYPTTSEPDPAPEGDVDLDAHVDDALGIVAIDRAQAAVNRAFAQRTPDVGEVND